MPVNRSDARLRAEERVPSSPSRDTGFIARHTGVALLLLLLSTVAFCIVVVIHRDHNARALALDNLAEPRQKLQQFVDAHGYLPSSFPGDLPGHPAIDYPPLHELLTLRNEEGPYVVYAAPITGLILPGGDGYAAIVYSHGRLRTEWLTGAEVRREREHREALIKGGSAADSP